LCKTSDLLIESALLILKHYLSLRLHLFSAKGAFFVIMISVKGSRFESFQEPFHVISEELPMKRLPARFNRKSKIQACL